MAMYWWRNAIGVLSFCQKIHPCFLPESIIHFFSHKNVMPWKCFKHYCPMMTSSNGNIFRVTGPLCGEFTGPGEFPTQRPVTRSFDVFCDLRLNNRLSKRPWGWWFETLSWSLWRNCNAFVQGIHRSAQRHDGPAMRAFFVSCAVGMNKLLNK